MRLRVKICGITSLDDALMCAGAGADALGFIFYANSPRCITPENARAIIHALPPFVTPVGVFVNEPPETIERIARATGIRAVQLSGDEPPGLCRQLSLYTIKAVRIHSEDEIEDALRYRTPAILLDGASNGTYGGSGVAADLSIAKKLSSRTRLILAGGLSPGNIVEAARFANPYAVDVNSGIESSPGRKDVYKVKRLFDALSHFSFDGQP